jgi:hypothetical protein
MCEMATHQAVLPGVSFRIGAGVMSASPETHWRNLMPITVTISLDLVSCTGLWSAIPEISKIGIFTITFWIVFDLSSERQVDPGNAASHTFPQLSLQGGV